MNIGEILKRGEPQTVGDALAQASSTQQLVLFKQRGGKRRGAVRPPEGARAGSPHEERPYLHARYPVHVVLQVVRAAGNLRRRLAYHAIREATRRECLSW